MTIVLLISLFIGGCAAATPRHVIMAPNVFHVGVPQKIHVALFSVSSQYTVEVQIQVQITRGSMITISSDRAVFSKEKPSGVLSLTVGLDNATEYLTRENNWQFFLVSRISNSHRSFTRNLVQITVSYSDGLVLIQTDKPIYTPNQKVKIRVVPLGFNMMPSTKKINLIIKNPQGIRVRQWNNLTTDTGFVSQVLDIGSNAMVGNWTVGVYYGHLFVHNTSKTFEVREYILPKFAVKIEGPHYIMSDTRPFKVSIQAKYTYGKPVQGTVSVRLHVVGVLKEPLHLYSFRSLLNRKGIFKLDVKMENIKRMLQDKWFPAIEGHRLQITADVTEKSTGKTETAVDDSIYFVVSPYRIKYIDTAGYFMPGLPFQLKVKVTYPNQEAVTNVHLVRTTKTLDENDNDLASQSYYHRQGGVETTAVTDENGVAMLVINVASQARKLIINVNTSDSTISKEQNAYKTLVVKASQFDELMKLKQNKPAKVGETARCEAVIGNRMSVQDRLFYFVVSRGQVVYEEMIDEVGTITTLPFKVTPSMSPSARLVAYYVIKSSGKIVSDSILLDIKDDFSNQILLLPPNNEKEWSPAKEYELKILGTIGSNVTLLGVDQSVYLLSKMNLLTPESVFEKLEKLDLGCGAGGGFKAKDVFKNAGMVVISHDREVLLPTNVGGGGGKCETGPRRNKRSIAGMQDDLGFCCNLGNETDPRNCFRRVMDLDVPHLKDEKLIHDCKEKYLNCCIDAFGLGDVGLLARSGHSEFVEQSEDPDVRNPAIRQYFPETWLNQELTISDNERTKGCRRLHRDAKCGSITFPVTLPDTLTTWVVQAIGVSNTTGFGIAKPLYITTFKPFFIHLSMPYSVQRGEEITIIATIFNYKNDDELVHLFLKGDERFCSIASPGKSSRLTSSGIKVKKQSSVSYAINVLPIKFGKIPIEVTAIGRFVDDQILKKLLVVPEGVEEIMTQSYVLDPKEFFKSRREQGERQQNDAESLSFNSTQAHNTSKGEQVNKIQLKINQKAVPESIDAKVYLTGNLIGQAVTNIAVGQLKHLLYLPYGCGEQNMNAVGPNVYAIHYLQATNQMTKEMESKKKDYIQGGYVRELNYRQDDGSFAFFSAARRKEPGSTWLTAFVVKVFCQAMSIKGIEIDKKTLCDSTLWLLKKQRKEDGAFIENLRVKYIKGLGSAGKVGAYTSDITLTAFVLIALKQCQCGGTSEKISVGKATALLERSVSTLTDAYTLAITTYALVLANSTEKLRANRRLVERATFNPATSTRYWETGSRPRNIKTAAYALMAQVALNRFEYAGPIVVWLTKQRGPKGGFASTTDSTVALEALAKYSELANMNKLDMKVWIKNKSSNLNKGTALLQQEIDIEPYINKELTVETKGTGVGQLQVNIKYNVPSKKRDRCDFHLRIKITEDENGKVVSEAKSDGHPRTRRATRGTKRKRNKSNRKSRRGNKRRKNRPKSGNSGKKPYPTKPFPQNHEIPKKLIVTICASYKKRGTTGMAIIDAGVLTGYSVIEESLTKLVKKENSSVERYELSDRAVVFYLDRIGNVKPLCVAFSVFRDFHVGGIQPVPVKVYDYYEPDDSCTVFYNLGQSSKSVGECKKSGICSCTQDKCPHANPRIKNAGRLRRRVCKHFDYAIKGKVVLIDEDETWLTYDVEVISVLKQPRQVDKPINATDLIMFRKQGMCISPHLEKKETVLFMGRIKNGQYILNNNAFVKRLDKVNEVVVDRVAARIRRRGCGS